MDVVAGASAGQYGRALRLLGAAEEIDAIIPAFIPIGVTRAEDAAREIAAAAAGLPGKPVIAVFMTAGPTPASLSEAGILAFTRPEQAVAALGQIAPAAPRPRGPAACATGTGAGGSGLSWVLVPGSGPGWVPSISRCSCAVRDRGAAAGGGARRYRARPSCAHGPRRPAAPDDVAVPAQDRVRGDQQPQSLASRFRYHGEQGREQGPVRPVQLRAARLPPLQDRELVAQDQDLGGLPGLLTSGQPRPLG